MTRPPGHTIVEALRWTGIVLAWIGAACLIMEMVR